MLAGNPNNKGYTYQPNNTCLRINNDPWGTKRWGQTLGKYKGLNGRPIAESKPLDEYFWYYHDKQRDFIMAWHPGFNDSLIFNLRYGNNWNSKWDGVWIKDLYENPTNSPWEATLCESYNQNYTTWLKLKPGCYGIRCAVHLGNAQVQWLDNRWYYRIPGEPFTLNANTIPLIAARTTDYTNKLWYLTNCIFFVDDEIEIQFDYLKGGGTWQYCNWEAELFRFTPPGYWKL